MKGFTSRVVEGAGISTGRKPGGRLLRGRVTVFTGKAAAVGGAVLHRRVGTERDGFGTPFQTNGHKHT